MSNDYDFSNVNQGRAGNVYDFKGVEVGERSDLNSKSRRLLLTTGTCNPEPSRLARVRGFQGLRGESVSQRQ